MAEPERSRIEYTNEALINNEHMQRIYKEISLFEQRLRVRVSLNLNIFVPGVNHQFLPIEVAEYMESLARVDSESLGTEDEEDSKCDICKESFGRPRGGRSLLFLLLLLLVQLLRAQQQQHHHYPHYHHHQHSSIMSTSPSASSGSQSKQQIL